MEKQQQGNEWIQRMEAIDYITVNAGPGARGEDYGLILNIWRHDVLFYSSTWNAMVVTQGLTKEEQDDDLGDTTEKWTRLIDLSTPALLTVAGYVKADVERTYGRFGAEVARIGQLAKEAGEWLNTLGSIDGLDFTANLPTIDSNHEDVQICKLSPGDDASMGPVMTDHLGAAHGFSKLDHLGMVSLAAHVESKLKAAVQ